MSRLIRVVVILLNIYQQNFQNIVLSLLIALNTVNTIKVDIVGYCT